MAFVVFPFFSGLPIYAVSIGVVSLLSGSKPEVVAGVIYNPALGEMTSAVRGRGCYLNNERIGNILRGGGGGGERRPPRESLLGESLVNVGFPVCREGTLLASSRAVAALATRVRGLRMVACASQAMAWVAQSKFGSYFSWDLNAWDVAAGMVIVEEAGGSVCNFDGTRADIAASRDMIMTCRPERSGEEGLLRDEILRVLRDNDCLRY
jgi:myo-inositol-1(or 4)-monophosphatase